MQQAAGVGEGRFATGTADDDAVLQARGQDGDACFERVLAQKQLPRAVGGMCNAGYRQEDEERCSQRSWHLRGQQLLMQNGSDEQCNKTQRTISLN